MVKLFIESGYAAKSLFVRILLPLWKIEICKHWLSRKNSKGLNLCFPTLFFHQRNLLKYSPGFLLVLTDPALFTRWWKQTCWAFGQFSCFDLFAFCLLVFDQIWYTCFVCLVNILFDPLFAVLSFYPLVCGIVRTAGGLLTLWLVQPRSVDQRNYSK